MDRTILIALVAGIAVLLFIFMFISGKMKKEDPEAKKSPNFRTLFYIGVTWLVLGVAAKIVTLWGMGLVLIFIGIENKDKWDDEKKWKDLSPKARKVKLFLVGGLTLLLLAMLAYTILFKGS
ncbi:MAG: hypothetical protein GXO69_06035 [Acidobacteria bacterium]|nr:hypothetical protein [Acidobacteriota bacterium]